MERLPCFHDLFDHFPELVDLDWKYAPVRRLVARLLNRRGKGLVDRFDSMPQQILKAQDHRKTEPILCTRFVNDLQNVDRCFGVLRRSDFDAAALIDCKITEPPTV